MARKELTAGGDEKKSRAFPGFGSVEALLSAVRPEPVPFERGARLWERLQEELRRQGGSVDDGSPSSPVPPAAVVPALAPFVGPAAVLTLTKAKLAALMAGTFLGGAAAGAGALLAWQADDAARDRHTHVTHAPESAAGAAQPPPLETAAAPETPSSTAAAAQASSPPRPPRSALHGSVAAAGDSSAWVLAQMRRAAGARDFEGALALAQQHEDRFPHAHVDEREALRIDALMQLGRSAEAERRARAVAAAQPAHRRAMERAIGHALP